MSDTRRAHPRNNGSKAARARERRERRDRRERGRRDEMATSMAGEFGHRSCGRKSRYATEALARQYADRTAAVTGADMHAYRCAICGGWHVTSHMMSRGTAERRLREGSAAMISATVRALARGPEGTRGEGTQRGGVRAEREGAM